MTIQFKKAERSQAKLKLAVQGPAGSGKTMGALSLATNLVPNGKIALIDTENESASLYADRFEFDTLPIRPPYESRFYAEGIDAAIDGGYDVLVIDSISHQWAGEGGILSRKEDAERADPRANSYTLWAKFTKEHEKFKAKILNAPIHIISTLRSKQDYILETNDRGKQQPKKVGMAPVQREGMEYEFTLVFDVGMNHSATASKDRTAMFGDRVVDLMDKAVAKELYKWLMSGKAVLPPTKEQVDQLTELLMATDSLERYGGRIKTLTTEQAAEWIAGLTAKVQAA